MSKLSITKAAEVFGVSRSTIQRRIRSGDLSCDVAGQGTVSNAKSIDISELVRVFGEPVTQRDTYRDTVSRHSMTHRSDTGGAASNNSLKLALELLKQVKSENEYLKRQLDEKDKQMSTQMKLFSNLLERK